MRAAERTLSWGVWLVTVLWLSGLLTPLLAEMEAISWKIGGAPVSLRSLVEGAISTVVILLVVLWLSASLEARLLRADGLHLSVRKIAANAIRAVLLLVGLLTALSAAGIPLGALGVLGGAVGVGIGLGLQKLASNYVSGFVILAERSLRIGDVVKVDNFEGRITDITTRYNRDPCGQRARVDRAERAVDHPAGREPVLCRPAGGVDQHGAGGLWHRPGWPDAASGRCDGRCAAGDPSACPVGPAQQLCRRRPRADLCLLGGRHRERSGQRQERCQPGHPACADQAPARRSRSRSAWCGGCRRPARPAPAAEAASRQPPHTSLRIPTRAPPAVRSAGQRQTSPGP